MLVAPPRHYPPLADAQDLSRGFGYFSVTAAPNVVGVRAANGSWFMWVVGTQSLAAAAATVASAFHGLTASLAVALWGIGVVLYLMLAGLSG